LPKSNTLYASVSQSIYQIRMLRLWKHLISRTKYKKSQPEMRIPKKFSSTMYLTLYSTPTLCSQRKSLKKRWWLSHPTNKEKLDSISWALTTFK
jgi:hypothetical protein